MIFGTKLEDCCETVIAALAAHIEHMEIEAEMSAQSKQRLTEENMALRHELDAVKAHAQMLEEKLAGVKSFCAQHLSTTRKGVDSDRDPFDESMAALQASLH